jgi:hypothetical protein
VFDKDYFSKLLRKAIGDRSIAEFSKSCNISRTHISNYVNKNYDNPPKPELIKVIADKGIGKASYHELMVAAGYLTNEEKINKAVKENPDLQKVWQSMQERDDLQLAFKQLSDMSPRNIREILRVIQRIQEEESTEDS